MTAAAVDFVRSSDLRQVSQRLAADVADVLRHAVSERGRAVLAVPGGTTPCEFLMGLGQRDLPWQAITILPTDERNVPPNDPRSNERMIRECLPMAADTFVPLRTTGGPAEPSDLAHRIRALGSLDAMVVGMGADAHITSLFPGDPRLAETVRESVPAVLAAHPDQLEPRLSLAPLVLMQARWKALLISGQDKLVALFRALASTDPVDSPVLLFFEGGVPPRVYCTE